MYKFFLSIGLIATCIVLESPWLFSGSRSGCGKHWSGIWQWGEAAAREDAPPERGPREILIEDNDLYLNNIAGLRIRGSQPVTIRKNRTYSNGGPGIAAEIQAEVMAEDCMVFENNEAGINIDEASRVVIKNSRVYSNRLGGVRILGKGGEGPLPTEMKISSSSIYKNNIGGIRSMPQAGRMVDLSVSGSDIHHNRGAGIRVENATSLTAMDNRIYENEDSGILAQLSASPAVLDLFRNNVNFNQGSGIRIIAGVPDLAKIRSNLIYNNLRSGITFDIQDPSAGKGANAKITNNTIVSNGGAGEGAGIRNDSPGKVEIMDNIIAYNFDAGISTKQCGGYSFNLYYANGDSGACCDNPHRAPYWVERAQISGCLSRGKGDLIADPLFINPDKYDFRLLDKSPALGAGHSSANDAGSSPKHDIGATGKAPAW